MTKISKEFGNTKQHAGRSNVDLKTLKFLTVKFPDIKSFVDIGCGLGGQVSLAKGLGLKAIGIDGDPTIKDFEGLIRHDYTKGPLKIEKHILGWTIEFLEHIKEKFMNNYFQTFLSCKYILCTYAPPGQGGRHHVNCQEEDYWIKKFNKINFDFDRNLSNEIRAQSEQKWIKDKALFFHNKGF